MADSHYELPNMANSGEEQMDEDAMDELIGLQPESKKRRLSVEQVRSLERSFEIETKLEPEKKLKLAQDLGLQPRQVAVWFQNRRARWKTKQLERDYSVLKSSYDALRSDYEDLEHEKKLLLAELETLKGKLEEETRDEGHSNLVASVKEESIIDSAREIVGGGERSIKGLSDYAVFVKEEQPCIDMNLKPLRLVVVKESEESFSPGSDSSAELVNEDKASFNPFMQAAPSSIKCISPWDSIANNDQNQGCMYLAEGIHTISLPTKGYQQLFKSEEGYIHEEGCNQYIDDLEHDKDVASGANITWWDY